MEAYLNPSESSDNKRPSDLDLGVEVPQKKAKMEEPMDSQASVETVEYNLDNELYEDDTVDSTLLGKRISTLTDEGTGCSSQVQLNGNSKLSETSHETIRRTISIERDARAISQMLNISNIDAVAAKVQANRASTNRKEVVTNEILENGIDSSHSEESTRKSDVKRVAAKNDENVVSSSVDVSAASDDTTMAIFNKMGMVYQKIKKEQPESKVDLNKLYVAVEMNLHKRHCVTIVAEQMKESKNTSEKSAPTRTKSPVSSSSSQSGQGGSGTTNSSSKENKDKVEDVARSPPAKKPAMRSVMSDAMDIMKEYPSHDPNHIYALLESVKDNPNRVGFVQNELDKTGECQPPPCEPDQGDCDNGNKKDPLMEDTKLISNIFPDRDQTEIYAYLEAHYNKPNRVQIVTEELLTGNEGRMGSQEKPFDLTGQSPLPEVGVNVTVESGSTSSSTAPSRQTPGTSNPTEILTGIIGADELGPMAALEQDVETMRAVFPDCDPMYLYSELEKLTNDPVRVERLSTHMMEMNTYPRLKERLEQLKRQRKQEQIRNMKFDAEDFLHLFPDPKKTFNDEEKTMSDGYKQHATTHLRNTFPMLKTGYIEKALKEHNYHYTPCLPDLEQSAAMFYAVHAGGEGRRRRNANKRFRRNPRDMEDLPENPDEFFYRELLYNDNKVALEDYITKKEEAKVKRIEEAKAGGELMECNCCFDDEVLPEDMLPCPSDHKFCKECIRRGAEAAIGQGKTSLQCMAGNCETDFGLATLQEVLPSKLMATLLRKVQEAEIAAAGVEGLESCPFCSYSVIMIDTGSKVFQCQNPECLKESCRECKEPSHIPLRCDEVEKQGETDMRKFIENRMTEAMIRTCYRCKKRFYKTEGCNKMTCSCGASMCYVCREPITGYDHFDGQNRCSQVNDVFDLHREEMEQAAAEAKEKYTNEHPETAGTELKNDPMKHLEEQGQDAAFRRAAPPLANPFPPLFMPPPPPPPPAPGQPFNFGGLMHQHINQPFGGFGQPQPMAGGMQGIPAMPPQQQQQQQQFFQQQQLIQQHQRQMQQQQQHHQRLMRNYQRTQQANMRRHLRQQAQMQQQMMQQQQDLGYLGGNLNEYDEAEYDDYEDSDDNVYNEGNDSSDEDNAEIYY